MARRSGQAMALRYKTFGALSTAWLAVVVLCTDPSMLRDAGLGWFMNWGIQMLVSFAYWKRPVSFPPRYYRPWSAHAPLRLARLLGVEQFGRIARWINPLSFDKRSPRALHAATMAAETTHLITLVLVGALAASFLVRRSLRMALFLGVWNVLFNLYPVALQRHNRARLRRVALRRLQDDVTAGEPAIPLRMDWFRSEAAEKVP
jgi:hypothetical protein